MGPNEGWLDGCEEGMLEGWLDGSEDALGAMEASIVGPWLSWDDGPLDELGRVDGHDEGLPETDGCAEGCALGWANTEGLKVGCLLGCVDGCDEGRPDELGLSLGCDVGQSETEGLSDG